MQLHDLTPAPGSTKNRKRVGRGNSSGHGTTSGRGQKGQLSVQKMYHRSTGFQDQVL